MQVVDIFFLFTFLLDKSYITLFHFHPLQDCSVGQAELRGTQNTSLYIFSDALRLGRGESFH